MTGSDEPARIWEAEPVAVGDHFLRFVKAVGEVLVVVNWYGTAVFFKDLDAFFEEFVARVQNLSFVVSGVLAVLADDQHCVASQFVAAAAQGLGDGGVHGEAEFARSVLALVAFGLLIDVERDDFAVGTVPAAAVGIADYEAVGKVLGVREVAIDGSDDGDAFGGHGRRKLRGKRRGVLRRN